MKSIAIIGGGPAGSMAAERLARSGAPVTLFEEKPGWEKPCGGGIPYKALRRYPFLLETSDPHTCIHDAELAAPNGNAVRLCLRQPLVIYSRGVLNRLLLQRAREAGAKIVQERILGFQRDASGWRLKGRGGAYRADYLILAAGARSRLRSRLTPPLGAQDFMLTFGYYVPASDRLLRVQFFEDFEGYAWSFPRTDHLDLGICGKVGESDMAGLRQRLHGFMERFGYPSASRTVFSHLLPALSVESWHNLRLAGDRWALAGDAGGLVDSVTGEGIYFALRSGELLAEALLEGAPQSYPQRVWRDFGARLALGARLSRYFYNQDFLGQPATSRLVEFSVRSRSFRQLVEDMVEGSQSYDGLDSRLYRTLGRAFWEMAVTSFVDGIRPTQKARLAAQAELHNFVEIAEEVTDVVEEPVHEAETRS